MNRDEKVNLVMFICVMLLSFSRGLYIDLLPGLKPAYAFLGFGILSFIIPREKRRKAECLGSGVQEGILGPAFHVWRRYGTGSDPD